MENFILCVVRFEFFPTVSIGNFKHIQPIVFRGAFKSQSNIAVGTFLQLSAFELFSLKAPSSIFDWVLNVHLY